MKADVEPKDKFYDRQPSVVIDPSLMLQLIYIDLSDQL